MPDQKVMRVHYQRPTKVTVGDIIQCPACRWKFVVMPDTVVQGMNYWDAQTQGPEPEGWKDDPDYIVCPKCSRSTDLSYYTELSCTGGIELANWGRAEDKKEVKLDATGKRSRKGTAQQRTGEQDRSQADRAKAGGP